MPWLVISLKVPSGAKGKSQSLKSEDHHKSMKCPKGAERRKATKRKKRKRDVIEWGGMGGIVTVEVTAELLKGVRLYFGMFA